RNSYDGASAEAAGSCHVNAQIMLGVIAANDLRAAQAGPGKSGAGIEASAGIGSHAARRSAAHDGVPLSKRNRNTVSTGNLFGAVGNQLKNLVKNEIFDLPHIRCLGALLTITTPAYLLMKGRESEEGLQRLAGRRQRCVS